MAEDGRGRPPPWGGAYNRELNKESSFIGLHKAVASIGVSTYQRLKYDLKQIAMPKWAQIAL